MIITIVAAPRRGFTLMEVLLVLAILVILGSLAVGVFTGVQKRANITRPEVRSGSLIRSCVSTILMLGNFRRT